MLMNQINLIVIGRIKNLIWFSIGWNLLAQLRRMLMMNSLLEEGSAFKLELSPNSFWILYFPKTHRKFAEKLKKFYWIATSLKMKLQNNIWARKHYLKLIFYQKNHSWKIYLINLYNQDKKETCKHSFQKKNSGKIMKILLLKKLVNLNFSKYSNTN